MTGSRPAFFEEEANGNVNQGRDVLMHYLSPLLDQDDFIHLGETNHFLHAFFKPEYQKAVYEKLNSLLTHILFREPFKAGSILLKYPDFLCRKGEVKEFFLDKENKPRCFKRISPLQYAIWGRDVPMLYWMLLYAAMFYAPAFERGKVNQWIGSLREKMEDVHVWCIYSLDELKKEMDRLLAFIPVDFLKNIMAEIEEIEQNGTAHGFFYDSSLLSTASKNYRKIYEHHSETHNHYDPHYADDIVSYWAELINLQQQSTLQTIHEYTRHDKRSTLLTFDTDYLPRINKICHDTSLFGKWKMKESYGIYRGESFPSQHGIYCSTNGVAQEQDGVMIEKLFEAREGQWEELRGIIKSRLDLQLSQQPSPAPFRND